MIMTQALWHGQHVNDTVFYRIGQEQHSLASQFGYVPLLRSVQRLFGYYRVYVPFRSVASWYGAHVNVHV